MSDYVTKKDLGEALDRYQASILEAVNVGFQDLKRENAEIKEAIRHLSYT